jgi:integrase
MGIVLNRGRYFWVKRIPKRYRGLVVGASGQPVTQVRQALHTDSKVEALAKAAQVEAARLAEWEAIRVGDSESARKNYLIAKKLAEARGLSYKPIDDLAAGDIVDLVNRVLSLATGQSLREPAPVTQAVLGAAPEALPTLSEVLEEYYSLTRTRHLQKSEAQKHRWKLPRERAVRNFLEVTGRKDAKGDLIPVPVDQITRADALKFRKWWSARVEGGMKIESANKDFGHLAEIFGTWAELTETEISNPFVKLRLEGRDERGVPPFTRNWIATKILAPDALSGLNEEARDVFLMMINTGLRPSEITDAPLEDFETSSNIPFFRVAAHGRELKVAHTKREIPLLGVSLEAARRIVSRGGISRYRHKAGGWSASVNKYLSNNHLKESPLHVAYSLRHYVENALLAAEVDDRVRADILGHKYNRPRYGDGGALEGRRIALERIAL